MSEQIEIVIDAEGDVKVKAIGVSGPGCKQLTTAIEAAIGKTTGDVKTAEFHQMSTCKVPQQAKASQ